MRDERMQVFQNETNILQILKMKLRIIFSSAIKSFQIGFSCWHPSFEIKVHNSKLPLTKDVSQIFPKKKKKSSAECC